jgi:hypothetical protein
LRTSYHDTAKRKKGKKEENQGSSNAAAPSQLHDMHLLPCAKAPQ